MTNLSNRYTRGFTIIEVLIVLAIAGLIMMIVLLAVPTLRSVQRDDQRKRDLATFAATVREYQNARNIVNAPFVEPTDQVKFDQFKAQFLGPEFDKYDVRFYNQYGNHEFPYEADTIIYFAYHYCSEDDAEEVTGWGIHPHFAYSVLVGLERTKDYFCLDQGNVDN